MKTCLIAAYFADKALQAHADGRFQAFARQLKKQGVPLTATLQLASAIKKPGNQTHTTLRASADDLTNVQNVQNVQNLITRCENEHNPV